MRRRRLAALSVAILLGACGGSGRAPTPTATAPTPTPPAGPVVASVSICEELATPGSYTLESDLPPTDLCLRVTASHVAVDCAEHSLGGIFLGSGVSDVSFQHCRSTGFAKSTDVSNVTIQDCTLSNIIYLDNPRNVLIQRDRISTTGRPAALVIIDGGDGNQVLDNELDGGYHGHDLTGQGSDGPGADDGIVLTNTSDDTVQGNTIANVFDAGVEGVDAVRGTTIADNTISNAIKAGVSSYWCTAWDGNVIRGNTVSQSLTLVWVVGGPGAACAAPSPVTFFINGTTISNNRLVGPLTLDKGPLATIGILVELPGTGNVLQGNDLGNYGITVGPSEAFTNGGGNVCGPQGNFHC